MAVAVTRSFRYQSLFPLADSDRTSPVVFRRFKCPEKAENSSENRDSVRSNSKKQENFARVFDDTKKNASAFEKESFLFRVCKRFASFRESELQIFQEVLERNIPRAFPKQFTCFSMGNMFPRDQKWKLFRSRRKRIGTSNTIRKAQQKKLSRKRYRKKLGKSKIFRFMSNIVNFNKFMKEKLLLNS